MAPNPKKKTTLAPHISDWWRNFRLFQSHSGRQLHKAQQVMDALLAQGMLGKGEEMYVDALSDLVAVYEDREVHLDEPSDAALLEHLIEARGESQSEVAANTGIAKSTISAILSGKRTLTREHINKLADYFNVDSAVFLRKLPQRKEPLGRRVARN